MSALERAVTEVKMSSMIATRDAYGEVLAELGA